MQFGVDIRNPMPEQMAAALLEAARAGRWDHWEHEIEAHARDWVKVGDMPRQLKAEQFARLPTAVARYPFVELCVYSYKGKTTWGFYCKKLPFEKYMLTRVLVVFDPVAGQIIHCMYCDKGKRYCERWGEQGKLFNEVRW